MGCFVFVEWFISDSEGEVVREASSEMSGTPVRLLPEDREDLKACLLQRELVQELRSPEGRATLRVSDEGVTLSHRFGGAATHRAPTPPLTHPVTPPPDPTP